MNVIRKILAPIASLKITVVLLAAAMLLIYCGTLAQRTAGIWQVKHEYFASWYVLIPFQNLKPFGPMQLNGWFPFIGGQSLIWALLINLLAAHTVRFKFNWKRSGILLIHFSLILLLAGELLTNSLAVESMMRIVEGDSTNYSEDSRTNELAITDRSPADHDKVVVVPQPMLGKQEQIKDARLPFEVTVVKNYPNSSLLGPMQPGGDQLADSGENKRLKIAARDKFVGTQAESVDMPSAFLKLTKDGKPLGTYLVSTWLNQPETVEVDGKKYDIALRPKRLFKPYTVTLLKFSHDKFVGTDMASNFSSRIRLVDSANHIDREHLIRMNEPLRYGGETFYQSSVLGNDIGTVLQVVRNPAWTLPYFACLLGAIGLVVHFTIVLLKFLRSQAIQQGGGTIYIPTGLFSAIPAIVLSFMSQPREPESSDKSGKRKRGEPFQLQPSRGFSSWAMIVPTAVVVICLMYVGGHAFAPAPKASSGADLDTFSRLPVLFDGRVMPMDSVARGTLKLISGRESIKLESGDRVQAIEWLTDVMVNNRRGNDYKVVRIDHTQVKALMGLNPDEKLFSISEIAKDENLQKLDEQMKALPDDSKTWDTYQKKIADLNSSIQLYVRLADTGHVADLYRVIKDPAEGRRLETLVQSTNEAQNPTAEQKQALKRASGLDHAMRRIRWLTDPQMAKSRAKYDLYFAAPMASGEEWQGLAVSASKAARGEPVNASVDTWCSMLNALDDQRISDFNTQLTKYSRDLAITPPKDSGKAGLEVYFNRFDPFTLSMVLYVGVFIFAAASWLGFHKPLRRTAVAIAVLALIIHTFGLLARMYISGRPPVTNLYSSAVFIGWGSVVLCLFLELIFKRGIGAAIVGAVGFGTLMVAGGLYVQQADQLGKLQAVLDTNLWLATHVVCITLGYAAMFVAGVIAMVYVVGNLIAGGFDSEVRKTFAKMTYGILCFAMILSFVGTILGGIWADQSWGRFWGWDPKENGAILIVLWVAVILHARWGGMIRERGIALLAILGNVVTLWSWFGTNMLGVGLHAYGFIDSALFWFYVACVAHLVWFAVGFIPVGKPDPAPAKPRQPVKAIPVT